MTLTLLAQMEALTGTTSTIALILIAGLMLLDKILPYLSKGKESSGKNSVTPDTVVFAFQKASEQERQKREHDALMTDLRSCLHQTTAALERVSDCLERNTAVVDRMEKRLMNGAIPIHYDSP